MFEKVSPESVGIKSEKVLDFVKTLNGLDLATHSIIMAKGNKIFAETYYEPFDDKFLHRMYSVSKSFVSVAVGLAMTQGLIKLDDKVVDYFPEFRNDNVDELYEQTTIRDALCMSTNVASFIPWYGKKDNRAAYYYEHPSLKVPATAFWYDSVGSYILNCIVEKLTGKTFLDYLKDEFLLEMGFSKESYTLYAPGGYTMGDSGVMCTSRDLLIFARFVMNKGEFNGKQYVDRKFMEDAISCQVYNDVGFGVAPHTKSGYGYLIWKTQGDGFCFNGAGDQYAVCDPKNDFIFVVTSDNQGDKTGAAIMFHELYKNLIPSIEKTALEENPDVYNELCEYLDSRKLVSVQGKTKVEMTDKVDGITYVLKENSSKISKFKLNFDEVGGTFEFEKDGDKKVLEFNYCSNKISEFPGEKRNSDTVSVLVDGKYKCATSAAWVDEKTFVIKSQIIDTFFGGLKVLFSFKDDCVTVLLRKYGQYVLEEYNEGYIVGYRE